MCFFNLLLIFIICLCDLFVAEMPIFLNPYGTFIIWLKYQDIFETYLAVFLLHEELQAETSFFAFSCYLTCLSQPDSP